MKWRVMIRTSEETVQVWIGGLSAEMADSTAALLRVWMPRSIFGAWTEPDWESVRSKPPATFVQTTSGGVDKIAA